MKKSNKVLLIALGSVLAILLAFFIYLGFTLKGLIPERGRIRLSPYQSSTVAANDKYRLN